MSTLGKTGYSVHSIYSADRNESYSAPSRTQFVEEYMLWHLKRHLGRSQTMLNHYYLHINTFDYAGDWARSMSQPPKIHYVKLLTSPQLSATGLCKGL